MALKNLMAWLQCRAADTPDTSEKNMGYQRKAPVHAGCTPDTFDTPRFVDTQAIVQTGRPGEAGNDPAPASAPPVNLPITTLDTKEMPLSSESAEPPIDLDAWRILAHVYHAHHFNCKFCIAAGRGTGYGLRCGTGAVLHAAYETAYDESKTRS